MGRIPTYRTVQLVVFSTETSGKQVEPSSEVSDAVGKMPREKPIDGWVYHVKVAP